MATIYAALLNQYKFKYLIIFSASFYNNNEEDQRSDEIEKFIKLKINNNLTEKDNHKIDIKLQIDYEIQIQEIKKSGWIFDKISSMKIGPYKTGEINGSSYVKIPSRSSA